MADVRYTVTEPFMAYPTGRLVRLSGEPPEAAVLDDKGKWRPEPTLDKFGTDDTRPILTVEEARHLAEHLGHPVALTPAIDLDAQAADEDAE